MSRGIRRAALIPPPTHVPAPPRESFALRPLTYVWAAGAAFWRCYDVDWGARGFHSGDHAHPGRFHPFTPSGAPEPLPVLYGADDLDGALSETVFHDVPVRGDKVVPLAKLRHRLAVALSSRRPLRLVDLTSDGLRCLELQRTELIDSDARSYEATARWARALHHHPDAFDGLYWVSRQHDTSRCILLFADRVSRDDLSVDQAVIPLTLGAGAGLDAVSEAAARANIAISGMGT